MLGGSRDQTDARQSLVCEIKKLGFSQNVKNFLTRLAFQKSSPLRIQMKKNYRFRHLTTAVTTCSWNLVPSLLTRSLNVFKIPNSSNRG